MLLRLLQKNEENGGNCKENFEIFKESLSKLTLSYYLLNISASAQKVKPLRTSRYPLENSINFPQQILTITENNDENDACELKNDFLIHSSSR